MRPPHSMNQAYVIRKTRLTLACSKTSPNCIALARIGPSLSRGWMAGGRYQCTLICLARIHLEIVRMRPMAAHQIKFMMPRWSIEAINTIYRPVCADPVKRMRPLTMIRSLDIGWEPRGSEKIDYDCSTAVLTPRALTCQYRSCVALC